MSYENLVTNYHSKVPFKRFEAEVLALVARPQELGAIFSLITSKLQKKGMRMATCNINAMLIVW